MIIVTTHKIQKTRPQEIIRYCVKQALKYFDQDKDNMKQWYFCLTVTVDESDTEEDIQEFCNQVNKELDDKTIILRVKKVTFLLASMAHFVISDTI